MHRMMLETLKHADNAFVTLTYADECLTMVDKGSGSFATLVPKHVQDWLKRLRKSVSPHRIRFYVVGEYGDATERPHYHAALFGFPTCLYGMSRYSRLRVSCCVNCDRVRDTWGFGNIFLGTLEEKSAQYIAGYVMKKMTDKEDLRLKGRYPEFARMSLRPGIGGEAVEDVVRALIGIDVGVDVPNGLRHGSRVLPLGRYLRRRLRVQLGREVNEPAKVSVERSAEMHSLYAANVADPSRSVKALLMDVDSAVVAQLDARRRIFKGRKPL